MLKVLLVDDDINVSVCLKEMIPWKELGYMIVGEASNGVEGLKLFANNLPDIVITDVKMPLMDGGELCQKIREISEDATIIILSAYEDFATAQLALKYGVTDYILKPINIQKINYLSGIFDNIAKNYQNRYFYNNLSNGIELSKEILQMLKQGNQEFFQEFFSVFTNCSASDFGVVKEACLKMISILCSYLEQMGMFPELIEKQRSKTIEGLNQLKRKMDMVTYVNKLYSDVMQFQLDKGTNHHNSAMEMIKKYIDENYTNKDINTSAIADKFFFSSDYLGKAFMRYLGTSIGAYVEDLRIKKSLELLRDTNISINNISSSVGYASPTYFNRVFKKSINLTPNEYRSKMRNINEEGF